MASRKLEVIISGDSTSLERAFGRAGKQSQTFGQKLGKAAKIGGLALGAMGIALGKIGWDEFAQGRSPPRRPPR